MILDLCPHCGCQLDEFGTCYRCDCGDAVPDPAFIAYLRRTSLRGQLATVTGPDWDGCPCHIGETVRVEDDRPGSEGYLTVSHGEQLLHFHVSCLLLPGDTQVAS